MNRIVTKGIVLSRTDYGEADRILTFLTADHGKIRAIAKGVRKQKSKLAGGIELFSVSDLTFLIGRGEIKTLISSRLYKHYGQIVKDLDRTNTGYTLIKKIDKATEEGPEAAYFYLLQESFDALDDSKINLGLINMWLNMQLLRLGGHTPNLHTDTQGQKLSPDKKYSLDLEDMHFAEDGQGIFTAAHIKFLRLGFSPNNVRALNRVKQSTVQTTALQPIVQSMLETFVRV
jgi:DNA repair protein RecO (recombination protein O)